MPTPWRERTCNLCGTNMVQDELHVLLECTSPCLQAVRDKYSPIVAECEDNMRDLMQEERSRDLSWFIHTCMRVVDVEYHDHDLNECED